MKVSLVGFKSLSFEDNEGRLIKGIKLFIAYPDDDVIGNAAEGLFVKKNVFDGFGIKQEQLTKAVGCVIDIEYGRKGKVVGLKIA